MNILHLKKAEFARQTAKLLKLGGMMQFEDDGWENAVFDANEEQTYSAIFFT